MLKRMLPSLIFLIPTLVFADTGLMTQELPHLAAPETGSEAVAEAWVPTADDETALCSAVEEARVPSAPLATCTADCWDDTQRICTGASCSAVDSACPSQRGHCWSNTEGYKYCPICETEDCDGDPCSSDKYCRLCCPFGWGFCSASYGCVCA
jgi:hypothetical protein